MPKRTMIKKPRHIAALIERGIFLLSKRLHADVRSMAMNPDMNKGTNSALATIINQLIMIIRSDINTTLIYPGTFSVSI